MRVMASNIQIIAANKFSVLLHLITAIFQNQRVEKWSNIFSLLTKKIYFQSGNCIVLFLYNYYPARDYNISADMLDLDKNHDKQEIQIIDQAAERPKKNKQRYPSQFFQAYLEKVNISDVQDLESMRKCFLQKLKLQHQGSINSDNQPSPKITLLDYTPNMEYLLIEVKYSHFTFPISILNINEPSETTKNRDFYQGGFSTVYRARLFNFDIAVKSNKITEESFQKIFFDTLKEFVIFKILELFEAGPAMTNVFGFQLLVFADSVQFSMEFCSHELRCRAAAQRELREGLLRMHLLHVVHSDVKPDNVCFSHAFGRYVFIDLGLHRVLAEELGEKTLTEFRGSMLYCSKELADCCLTGPQPVDLYHNDAEALNKTLDEVKELQEQRIQSVPEQFNLLQSNTFLKILIKHLSVYINFKPFKHDQLHKWYHIFRLLRRLEEQQVMEIAYFLQMLTHTEMVNRMVEELSLYIPLLKTGFLKENILNHDLQIEKDYHINPLFKERFLKIVNHKEDEKQETVAHDNIIILQNQNDVAKIGKETYYFLLTRCLQVNCFGVGLEEARKASEVFLAVEAKRKAVATDGHEDRLKQCFAFVFDWALGQPAVTAQVYAVIEQTVPSVVLLEAAEEPALVDRLLRLLDLPAPPLLRVRLCLLVLSSLEWVHQKYAPKYSYFRMMDAVCSHMQHTVQNIKKQPLSEEEQTFVQYLQITTTRSRITQKRSKIFLILVGFLSLNLFDLLNCNKQKAVLRRQFILYWLHYLDKQNLKSSLFRFLFDRVAEQIIKREIAISKKISYYYNMHINKYSSSSFRTLGPLHQLAHFSFYSQLTIIEEMRLAADEAAGEDGIAQLANRYEQLVQTLNPQTINFMEFFVSSFKRHRYLHLASPLTLTIDYDIILSQLLEIDRYERYHEHEVAFYLFYLNNTVSELTALFERLNVQEDLRISYFSKAAGLIDRLQCFYCKYKALIGYNKSLLRFVSAEERHQVQEHVLDLIVSLIQLNDRGSQPMIFEIIKDCCQFYLEVGGFQSKYDYLALLYEWSLRVQSFIPSFFLAASSDYYQTQLRFLMFVWRCRYSFGEQDAYFRTIVTLCNYFNGFSYQSSISTFAHIISLFQQLIVDYGQFFSENQEFILKESRSDKSNRYLALYAAIIMHPVYLQSLKISPRYLYFIWCKLHQLDTFGKTVVSSSVYWASYTHILKAQKAKQRRIDSFCKKELKVAKINSAEFNRFLGNDRSNKWMESILKIIRKRTHEQPFNAMKYELILKKVQKYASCHK